MKSVMTVILSCFCVLLCAITCQGLTVRASHDLKTSSIRLCQRASSDIPSYDKPRSSNRVFKTSRGSFGLWVNPAKWTLSNRKFNEDAEFQLKYVPGDGYALVISERISMPIESLRDLAYENAKKAAPDARIVSEEKRIVNGREIICLLFESTVRGIPFTSYGYYYSGDEGTIQVITMTGQNLFREYREELTELLNGLVILKKSSSLPIPETVQVDPGHEPRSDDFPLTRSPSRVPSGIPSAGPGPGAGGSSSAGMSIPSRNNAVATVVDRKPIPLNLPQPRYTEEARKNKVEGFVYLRALVGADGLIKQVNVISGLPDGLDEQAIRAVYQMHFKPATKDNNPVGYWVPIQVEFNLCTDCKPPK